MRPAVLVSDDQSVIIWLGYFGAGGREEEEKTLEKVASREAKFIMDGISKKLIKDGIHSTIRVNFPRISEFLATTLLVISRSADFVSC